jgi:hypothetical protein
MILVVPLVCMVLGQAPTTPLSGMVVGPNGEPVAGAEVLLGGLPIQDQIIVARGRSDGQGRFKFERPAALAGENRYTTPILWAVKPGFRLGFVRFPGPLPKPGEPARVVLGPPGRGEVRVEGPNGEPVAGARIRLEWFGHGQINVPEAVEDLIEAATDKDGLAVIDAAANDEIAYVDVHAKGFGVQGRPFRPLTSQPKRVRLRPVASLEGRLQADDPAMVKGWRVFAYTYAGDRWSTDPQTTGFDKGTTDAEGRFSFPVMAPGSLQLVVKPPGELPVMADVPDSLAVVAGRPNSVIVPLRKTVTITGIVRERDTGRAVPGAEMHLSPARGGMVRTARTDARGSYTFSSLPGKWHVSPSRLPPTLIRAPGPSWREVTLAEGQGRVELEPWEAIPAAPTLRFVVRDEQGRPAAHASITGQSGSHYMPATTDDNGEFAVPGLQPNTEVSIEVRQGERMTDGPVKVLVGTPGTVQVTIMPGLALALSGRVVGPGGTSIADAEVRVQFREKSPPGGGFSFPQTPGFGDGAEIHTGTDGTFRTPKEIYRKNREFRVEVLAPGFYNGKTDWESADGGELITFPDLVLRPRTTQRLVSGRVVDRRGTGVAAVTVFQPADSSARTEAITDDAGRFRLDGVPSGSALLFAEKAGYRFGGAIVGADDRPVELRLARLEEPPLSIPKPVPPPLSRAEERFAALELIAPLVDSARSGKLGQMGQAVVPALARVDPDRVLEMLENRVLPQAAGVLYQVALGQLEDDPNAAVATIEADRDPAARAEGFLALVDALPDAQRERRVELIDRTLAEVRQVEDREPRLRLLGRIADRWLELGLVDRATSVLRQGRALIASLPRDQFSFAAEEFAEVLSVIDLRTAKTMFERKDPKNANATDPVTIQRHHGEAAVRLAAINPAEAEGLVPQIVPNLWSGARDDYVLRICQRMARADLPRARKILETLDEPSGPDSRPRPELVAEGLALMADELAATDPTGARKLLDEAFDRLRKIASEEHRGNDLPVSNRMAALLPLVERIDPDRLEERLWLAAAYRAPLFEHAFLNQLQEPVALAALVARYDRAMAEAIIAPALDRMPGLLVDGSDFLYYHSTFIKALAAYDPRAVTAMVRGLPASARKAPPPQNNWQGASIDAQVRLAAAEALGLSVEERYRKVLGGHLGRRSVRPVP